jgi:hypothetical protein
MSRNPSELPAQPVDIAAAARCRGSSERRHDRDREQTVGQLEEMGAAR